ncbi:pentapeptide repeat-containing protein [Streptomyces sp. NPDC093223]|uniref:pentapeptide repeat-containing protein n=1 Tax=Streptomyces sp. NPDC093223 TaxID=3366033 RepID=UPI0038077170
MHQQQKQPSRREQISWTLVGIAVVAGLALLLAKGPWWLDGRHLAELNKDDAPKAVMVTGFRTAVVTFGLAAVAVLGSYLTWRNLQVTREALRQTRERDDNQHAIAQKSLEHTRMIDREKQDLARAEHVTERFVKAVGLLAAESNTSQLGGIYALERIMTDSPEDALTIVQLLAGSIRESSKRQRSENGGKDPETVREPDRAAFTVIARRNNGISGTERTRALNFRRANLAGISLTGIDVSALFGADFTSAKLNNSQFNGASLMDAVFSKANLRWSNLGHCDLRGAHIDQEADLQHAVLDDADLANASLRSAQVQGASFRRSDLTGADLHEANFGADGDSIAIVESEQLLKAHVTSSTRLPSHLKNAPGMKEHIKRCTLEHVAGVKHGEPLRGS